MKRFLAGILVLIMLCMAGITASSEVIIPMTWEEAQSMYVTSSDHVLYIQEGRFIIKAVYADTGRLYMVERGTTMDGIYSYTRSFYDEAGNVVETTSGSEEIQPLMQTTLVRDYSGSVIGVRCTIGTEGYMVAYGMVFRLVNYNDTWYQYPCESFDSVPEPYRTAMLNVYPYIDPYPPIGPVVKAGWEQVGKQWKYKMADGTYARERWLQVDGKWYYFESNGIMKANAWQGDYYLTGDGSMAVSTWIGPYYVDASGKWVPEMSRWYQENGRWKYGTLKSCWKQIDGKWYYFDANGYMVTNTTIDGYRIGPDGVWIP